MSTAGVGAGSVAVDLFRAEWKAAAKLRGINAPLPSNWQDRFYAWMAKGMSTRELVDLIPRAMDRDGVNSRWQYFGGVVQNNMWKVRCR